MSIRKSIVLAAVAALFAILPSRAEAQTVNTAHADTLAKAAATDTIAIAAQADTLAQPICQLTDSLAQTHCQKPDSLIQHVCQQRDTLAKKVCQHPDSLIHLRCHKADTLAKKVCQHPDSLIHLRCHKADTLAKADSLFFPRCHKHDTLVRMRCHKRDSLVRLFCQHPDSLIYHRCHRPDSLVRPRCPKHDSLARRFCQHADSLLPPRCLHPDSLSHRHFCHRLDSLSRATADSMAKHRCPRADSLAQRDSLAMLDSLRRASISIGTNLLFLGTSSPNVQLLFPIGDYFTASLILGFKPWPRWAPWDWADGDVRWRHFEIAPGLRWWPKYNYDGLFVGADLAWAHYNIGGIAVPFGLYKDLRDYRLQGDLFSLTLSAGYSWWLSKHTRLELEAGIVGGYYNADKYECPHCGAHLGQVDGPAFLPKLNIGIAYNFFKEKKARRPKFECDPAACMHAMPRDPGTDALRREFVRKLHELEPAREACQTAKATEPTASTAPSQTSDPR